MNNKNVEEQIKDLFMELLKFLSDPNRKDCSAPSELLRRIFKIYFQQMEASTEDLFVNERLLIQAYEFITKKKCPEIQVSNKQVIDDELFARRDSLVVDFN